MAEGAGDKQLVVVLLLSRIRLLPHFPAGKEKTFYLSELRTKVATPPERKIARDARYGRGAHTTFFLNTTPHFGSSRHALLNQKNCFERKKMHRFDPG